MKLIDTHCHFNYYEDREEQKSAIENARKELEAAINIGCCLESSKESLLLSNNDFIYFTAGIHPNYCNNFKEEDLEELNSLLASDKAVAIGEIGLDYYRDIVTKEKQKIAFIKQLELAVKLKLPVVIHGREAYTDIFDILQSDDFKNITVVMHSYAGSYDEVKSLLERAYVSFSGILTFPNAKIVHECCEKLPLDRILVETDSPYLAPQPVRGRKNFPHYVQYVAEKLAEIKNISYDEAIRSTNENTKRVFKI